jgi:hypothetical protein
MKFRGLQALTDTNVNQACGLSRRSFCTEGFSILLDTHVLEEQDRAEVSPLRRDSRSLVRAQFLEHLSFATSAKRAVRPRFLFLRSRGAYSTLRRTGLHAQDPGGTRP